MNATSSSDRYEAARKALTEHGHRDATPEDPGSIAQLTVALRALIEPPATEETPEQIAIRVYKGIHDFPVVVDGDAIRDLITRGILAGIQAAWESWEPETAPGYEPEQTAPTFKPESEPDWYRRQWELLDNDNDEPFQAQIGASDVFMLTPSQARRILEMLSSEHGSDEYDPSSEAGA